MSSGKSLGDLNPLYPDAYRGLKDIYISDLGYSAVQILKNKGFFVQGSITAGLSLPAGNTLDRAGNLYVADYGNTVINEYRPGIAQPFQTYSAGMIFPVNVTVNREGDVFEADYGNGLEYDGLVNEYKQGRNKVTLTCSPSGSVESVAVDSAGDVFVAYNLQSGGKVLEYKGGLAGCKATGFGVTLGTAGGMVLDKSGNLIVADLLGHVIDVVAPPYTSVTRTLGPSYGSPNNVAINRDNTKSSPPTPTTPPSMSSTTQPARRSRSLEACILG